MPLFCVKNICFLWFFLFFKDEKRNLHKLSTFEYVKKNQFAGFL
jgi:hypothetical protein